MVLSWKKKKSSTHHRPGKKILRTACSVLTIPVVFYRRKYIPPEKSGLCSDYSVIVGNDFKGEIYSLGRGVVEGGRFCN